jgi:hypothetical protein
LTIQTATNAGKDAGVQGKREKILKKKKKRDRMVI